MDYKPAPFGLSDINLSKDILELIESLARNAHEAWAELRFAEGWRTGSERSDERKEHPGLIPYEELSESEKEYDRQTVLQTIKAMLAMGYSIHPPAEGERPRVLSSGLSSDAPNLPASSAQSRLGLQRVQDERVSGASLSKPEDFASLARRALQVGEPLRAYDAAAEGVERFPNHVELRQLLALALARSGASDRANAILTKLYAAGYRDEETLGLLARTHKDLARAAGESTAAQLHLRRAFEYYTQAYRNSAGYWSGLNAATLALLVGEHGTATALAGEVAPLCRQKLTQGRLANEERYWILSSLGQTALLQRHWSEAEDWYSKALEIGRGNWGTLQSTRHSAKLITEHFGEGGQLFERLFHFPSVLMFVGHMVDQVGRRNPRFPPQLEGAVMEAIRSRLRSLDAQFGYAAAACGSDILFHEAMLERNAETHVVLPYEREFFAKDSVEVVVIGDWGRRFQRIAERATELQEASKRSQMCGKVSFEFANLLLHGLASIHALQLDTKLVALAVWDGRPGDGPDGTAGTIERWRNSGLKPEIIDLATILAESSLDVSSEGALPEVRDRTHGNGAGGEFAAEIRALLFADAEGFSKLSDEEVPLFVRHFLGLAASLAKESAHKPLAKNTWGDGLYFVFEHVRDAGLFALELRDQVVGTDWAARGLPSLNLRIGLHAGPVYSCTDPVTQRRNYVGAHVSRAARIEPVTPIGQVYASQSFAALAAAQGVEDFRCSYVGQTAMAKKYGSLPTYVVSRSNSTKRENDSVPWSERPCEP